MTVCALPLQQNGCSALRAAANRPRKSGRNNPNHAVRYSCSHRQRERSHNSNARAHSATRAHSVATEQPVPPDVTILRPVTVKHLSSSRCCEPATHIKTQQPESCSRMKLQSSAARTQAQQQRKSAFGGSKPAVPPDMTVCKHIAAKRLLCSCCCATTRTTQHSHVNGTARYSCRKIWLEHRRNSNAYANSAGLSLPYVQI